MPSSSSSWNLRSLFTFRNNINSPLDSSSNLYSPLVDHNKKTRRLLTHTVTSHGLVLAKTHVTDWFILVLLALTMFALNRIHPFYRYVGKDMMADLKYPLKDNTVPMWAVRVYAVLLPMAIFMVFYYYRRDVYDLHHAILGLLFSVMLTGVITNAIKDAVGRPRPDFFWRCFPDGKDLYDQLGNVICHGDSKVVREGHKSFPSGHASWSFSGLGFLSLYLSGKVRVFDRKGHVAKLCIVFLPLLVASLVGISRVDDYWHHWQDVFAGGLIGKFTLVWRTFFLYYHEDLLKKTLLTGGSWIHTNQALITSFGELSICILFFVGMTMAMFCYLQFFAPPYHAEGWGPYAFFRAREDSVTQTDMVESSSDNSRLTIDDPESVIR